MVLVVDFVAYFFLHLFLLFFLYLIYHFLLLMAQAAAETARNKKTEYIYTTTMGTPFIVFVVVTLN